MRRDETLPGARVKAALALRGAGEGPLRARYGYFGKVPAEVLELGDHNAVALYAYLDLRAGKRGFWWGTQKEIGEAIRMSVASVQRATKTLLIAGEITSVRHAHRRRELEYTITRRVGNDALRTVQSVTTDASRGIQHVTDGASSATDPKTTDPETTDPQGLSGARAPEIVSTLFTGLVMDIPRLTLLIEQALSKSYEIQDIERAAQELRNSRAPINDPVAWLIPKLEDIWAHSNNGEVPPQLSAQPRRRNTYRPIRSRASEP